MPDASVELGEIGKTVMRRTPAAFRCPKETTRRQHSDSIEERVLPQSWPGFKHVGRLFDIAWEWRPPLFTGKSCRFYTLPLTQLHVSSLSRK